MSYDFRADGTGEEICFQIGGPQPLPVTDCSSTGTGAWGATRFQLIFNWPFIFIWFSS
jgi:hypothetical protein